MNAIHSSQQQQMEIEPFRQTHLLSHQQQKQQQQSQQTDNQATEMGIFEPVSNQMQVNGIEEVSKQHLIPNLMDMNVLHHQHAHNHNQTNHHPYHTAHLESQQPHYATRHAQQQQQQQPQLLQLHAASQQQHNNTSNSIGTNSSAIDMHLSASLTTSGVNCLTPPQQAQVQSGEEPANQQQATAPKSTSCDDNDDLAESNLLTDNHSSNANNQQELTGVLANSSSSGSQRRANIDGIAADDPVVLWLLDNYEMADGDSLPRSTVYDHYMAFCKEVNLTHVNAASFGKLIRSVFAGLKTRRLGTRGHSKYHYYGIKVKFDSSAHHMLQQMAAAGANNDQNEGSIQNSDASESDSIIESQQHSNNNSSSTNNNNAGQQANTGKRAKRAHTMSSGSKRYCNQQSEINHYKTNFEANNFHSQPQLHQLPHAHGTNQLQHLYGSHLHQQQTSHGVEAHELANMIPMSNHALDTSISDPQYAQLNQQHGQLIQHPHYPQQHQLEQHLQLQIMQEPSGHVGYVSTQASGESSIPVDQQHLTYIHSHHSNNQQPQHPHQQQSHHHQQHHISGHTHHSLNGENQPLNQAHHQQQLQQQQQQHQLYQQQPHHQHYQQQHQHNQPQQQHLATNYSNRVQQFELESLRAYLDQSTTPEQLISNCWPSEPLIEQKFIVELTQTSGLSVGCLQILEMRYKSHWQRIVELLGELKFAHVEQVLLDFWHPTCEWRQSNLELESAKSSDQVNKLDNSTSTSQPQEELQESSAAQAVSTQSQSQSQSHSQCHSNENTNADISTCLGDSSPKANKTTTGTHNDVSPQYATNSLQNENSLTFQTLFQLTTSSKKLVDWILRVDNSMYTSLKNFLVPDALNPMPAPLRQSIKDFAKNLSTWTQSSLKDYEQSFVFNKLKLSESFGSTLCRCASLNHLAKAARAVWQQQAMLEQMSIDLSLLDLRDIEHQVELMVSNSSSIDVSDNNDDRQGDKTHLSNLKNATPTKHSNADFNEKDEERAHAGDDYNEIVETNDKAVEDKVDNKKRRMASQPNRSISSSAPGKSISPSQLVDKLLQLLNSPSPETSWPNWCRNLVDSSSSSTTLTQQATNTSSVSSSPANSLTLLQDEAQLFILNFNFQISLIGKELTLRSAPSLSSYVLISMLFDEYIYYLVAAKLASAAETQTTTNTKRV